MKRPRNWAKLDTTWYDDEVLQAIAETDPMILALWPILIAKSKADSDTDANPTGIVSTSAKQLSTKLNVEVPSVEKLLALLAEGEMIETSRGRLGTLKVTLNKFNKWQHATGSAADRKAAERDRAEELLQGKSAVASQLVARLSQNVTRREENREEENRIDSSPLTPRITPQVSRIPEVADEAIFVKAIADRLASIVSTRSQAEAAADQLLFASKRPHPVSRRVESLHQYQQSVDNYVAKVVGGWQPVGNAIGYIIKAAADAAPPMEIDPSKIGSMPAITTQASKDLARYQAYMASNNDGAD